MDELKEKRRQLRTEIQRCKLILDLEKQPGWAQLVEYFEFKKNESLKQLALAPLDAVKELQEQYKAFNSLTSAMKTFKIVRDNYVFELEQLAESESDNSTI